MPNKPKDSSHAAILAMATLFLLLAGCRANAQATKPAPGYTLEFEHSDDFGDTVVVCRDLPPGFVVGGGDNCDFHSFPDPVSCHFFPNKKNKFEGPRSCGKHPETLPNRCGTSFGCQNLKAFDFPGARNEEQP